MGSTPVRAATSETAFFIGKTAKRQFALAHIRKRIPATAVCSYCRGEIAGNKFINANEAIVLRLHLGCVEELIRDLKDWVYRYWKEKHWASAKKESGLFLLSVSSMQPSSVLKLAQGLDEWICQYEQEKSRDARCT